MFGFFKNLKSKSESINAYCWDAMKCYLFLKDDIALDAMIASLVVMGNSQRNSMIMALNDFIPKIGGRIADICSNEHDIKEAQERLNNLNEAIELIRSKNWGLVDIANAKMQLGRTDKSAEIALSESDGVYFKRKYNFPDILTDV